MTDTENLGHSDWQSVFKDRGVWHLTEDYLAGWHRRNASFYKYITSHVREGDRILELGCGPGRHAIILSNLGYEVTCIDVDPGVLACAEDNARRLARTPINFQLCDMNEVLERFGPKSFAAITHGGVMEHFENEEAIRKSLATQAKVSNHIIFDVPIESEGNKRLFQRDTIFRNVWPPSYWIETVLADFRIVDYAVEMRGQPGMTDDLICVLSE